MPELYEIPVLEVRHVIESLTDKTWYVSRNFNADTGEYLWLATTRHDTETYGVLSKAGNIKKLLLLLEAAPTFLRNR
jgi:hypothetical protein